MGRRGVVKLGHREMVDQRTRDWILPISGYNMMEAPRKLPLSNCH